MSKIYHQRQFISPRQTRSATMRALNLAGKLAPSYRRPSADALWKAAHKSIPAAQNAVAEPDSDATVALAQLTDSMNGSSRLNFIGRISAFDDSKRMARNHLLIRALLKSQPAIAQTPLPAPIFVIGMPRTGTTYLHTLLAQDPRHRCIPYWESFEPVPPATGPDQRIERLTKMLGQMDQIAPNYQAIHPMTAESPEECVALFMNEFRTIQFDIQYRVPEYVAWVQAQDASIAYRAYRQQLKILQHLRPAGDRLVLKDPSHTLHVRTICEVFPDARFVFIHRDPAESLSSICSLYAYTRAMFSDDVDADAIGREVLNGYWPSAMDDAMQVRASLPEARFTDARQKDLREDPVAALRRIYTELDIEFDPPAQRALEAYLGAAARAPRHRHEHSPEGFGLTKGLLRERMQAYVEDFDL